MEIDPATISSGPITIVRRGLSFYGDRTTETPALKLDWPANSIVQLGTDAPQIFQYLKEYIDAASIAGAVPASTTAAGIVVEASQAEVNAGTDTKTVSAVSYKLFATPSKILSAILTKLGFAAAPVFSTTTGTTLALTTVASQKVMVWAKGQIAVSTGLDPDITVSLKYNGVAKDSLVYPTSSIHSGGFALQYTETPGAGTHNITVEGSGGGTYSISNVVITVLKL
jgi:hypothetical protein